MPLTSMATSGLVTRESVPFGPVTLTLWPSTDTVTFSVTGYGHGVGMSQNGARSMAESGCDWETILSYFYEGISLKRGDGL